MSAVEPIIHRARTKIVATVGPACDDPGTLCDMVGAGVDVFRINMAHGTRDDHQRMLTQVRDAAKQGGRPVGVLVDLAGPKIRLGEIANEPLECRRDETLHFVRGQPQSSDELTSSYAPLIDELNELDRVLLADGTVELVVTGTSADRATCRVIGPGELRSRQGINLPGVRLSVPAMNDTDRENARWAASHDVDFVSLSFVRAAQDVLELKEILRQANSSALTVAKIEKPEALERLDEIVQAADGIMVARGDLGVETDVAEMPVQQKTIINACSRWKKPVIVATQMLDSMQRSRRPTRAEVTDVANAILDGADACMLSGETAIGRFPVESAQMMNRIMLSTEASLQSENARRDVRAGQIDSVHPITGAVVTGAAQIAHLLDAQMVVIATRSGTTALAKAKRRDFIPTVAVSDRSSTLRQMTLYWGINPLIGAPDNLDRDLIPFVVGWGREHGVLKSEDLIVVVAGTHVREGAHNQLVVHEVP